MSKLLWKTIHDCEFNKEDDFLETILTQAGIKDIEAFLNVRKAHTHSPFLFENMNEAIELLHKYKNGTIYIKRDPDVDGITSASYVQGFVELIAPDSKIVCSTNYNKEHGLVKKDIDTLEDELIDLVIIPDASIDINLMVTIWEKLRVPILILDHHDIDKKLLNVKNLVLVNCQDNSYPNKTLSGVGMVHKFAQAYCSQYDYPKEIYEYFTDLVALGLIGDSMDMRNLETRYYALEGLKEENRHNEFIQELAIRFAEDMKLGHTLRNYGWVIAPKLNAVVRYGTPEEQNNLYRAVVGVQEDIEYQPRRKHKEDPKPPIEIHSLQKTMARVCTNVKARQDNEVRKYVKSLIEKITEENLDRNSVIILDGTNILKKKSVTGLIANKIAEKYHRPVVILKAKNKEVFGGSGRGYNKGKIENFNTFLKETNVFEKVEGHPNAFGISLKKENLQKAIDICNEKLSLDDLVTVHEVDYEVKARNLTPKAVMKVAESYDIWGKGCEEPVFAITEIEIPAKQIIGYGDNNGFIKFSYNNVDYIKKYCPRGEFEDMTLRDRLTLGENKKILHMTIIGSFDLNEYEGNRYPQIKINHFESEECVPTSKNKVSIDDDFLF